MKEMIKKLMPFIILLLIIPVIYAPSKKNVEIYVNEEYVIGGKTITVLSLTSSKILIQVDGTKKIIDATGISTVDWIKFSVVETYLDEEMVNSYAKFNISMDYTCGNKKCETKEDEIICCKDCGCENNVTEVCSNNQCLEVECKENQDCEDNNSCTTDKCKDNLCVNNLITSCKDNDDCCPDGCSRSKDKDCSATSNDQTNTETTTKTSDTSQEPSVCEEGDVNDRKYCKNNKWIAQKPLNNLCTQDYECISNFCENNICSEDKTIYDPLLPSSERKTIFQKILDFITSLFS